MLPGITPIAERCVNTRLKMEKKSRLVILEKKSCLMMAILEAIGEGAETPTSEGSSLND